MGFDDDDDDESRLENSCESAIISPKSCAYEALSKWNYHICLCLPSIFLPAFPTHRTSLFCITHIESTKCRHTFDEAQIVSSGMKSLFAPHSHWPKWAYHFNVVCLWVFWIWCECGGFNWIASMRTNRISKYRNNNNNLLFYSVCVWCSNFDIGYCYIKPTHT